MWLARVVAVCGLLSLGQAWAQDYPAKPVRIFVGSPGASGDVSLRLLAPALSNNLHQPVIIENRAGAIPLESFRQASADGYTLLEDGPSLWIGPLLKELNYDVLRDFVPISATDRSVQLLAIPASVPANNVREFIALAKAKPGSLNYATGSSGSFSHLVAASFLSVTGIELTRIPYKGGGEAVKSAFSGETQMVFSSAGALLPYVKAGKLKALGVGSLGPSALAPGVPTIASQGLPGFEATLFQGLFALGKTPESVVRKLNQEVVRTLASEDLKARYQNIGFEAYGNTPEEFAALLRSEVAKWDRLIKAQGIKGE